MDQQELLKNCLENAVSKARRNRNKLTRKELSDIFGELLLSDVQLGLVENYLAEKKIIVMSKDDEEQEAASIDYDIDLDNDDRTAIEFYYEEVKALPYLTDKEKERIFKAAMSGDAQAQERTVSIYLPEVIEIAKLYAGQGIPVEDLIGEGNIALVMACQLLNCVENISDFDGHMGKIIMDAMDALVRDEQSEEKLVLKIGKELKKNTDTKVPQLSKAQEDLFNGDELLKEAFLELAKDDEVKDED